MLKNLSFLLVALVSFIGHSQEYRFNQYTTDDGISQNFIYTINQDANGYLWVGTGEGLCKFDGKNFITYTTIDGLSEDVITCTFESKDGVEWFGHNEGGITKYVDGKFVQIQTDKSVISKITAFAETSETLFFLSQNQGLYAIENNEINRIGDYGKENFFDIKVINEQNILLATDEGLIHVEKNGPLWASKGAYLQEEWISTIAECSEENTFYVGKKSGGIIKTRLHNGELQISKWDGLQDMNEFKITRIIEDADSNIWIATSGQGLIKTNPNPEKEGEFDLTFYNESTGLSSNFVNSIFQDREGNIWIGTFGAGLSTLIDDFFTFYSHDPNRGIGNNVSAIWIDDENKWYGVENGLIRISNKLENKFEFYNNQNGFINDQVTSLFQSDNSMWIGTANNGMYQLDLVTEKLTKIKWDFGSLQSRVNQITADQRSVWVATEGGLIVYNIANKSTNLFDTQLGLAHNSIKSVYRDRLGKVWMGTHSRYLYAIYNSSIEEYEMTNVGELEVIQITEDIEGDIWVATAESGIYKKIGRKFVNFSSDDGLKSNYTYSIGSDSRGFIWVGHRGGLSKVSPEGDQIKFYDYKSGIDAQLNSRAVYLDNKNNLWFGTNQGGIKYDPEKDKKNNIAPVINLLGITINDKAYNIKETIELPYGKYRMQFDFIGISFKNPEKVKYQFQLIGHDEVLSIPTSEMNASYGKITDGEYTFKVIACTDKKICSENAATVKIKIAKPYWKTWWFYFILASFIIASVYFLIRMRVKRFKATQAYLEKQLAIKTKEVVEKAEKIEEINHDLTSSINYAKRIQTALLPIDGVLEKYFPDSFIFFKPRDVVSGDFYFIREYENKIIVACCDCTGHGVPGAFMSMIGSTTFRNIYKLMETSGKWQTPEKVLEVLDAEIQKILHQKVEAATKEEDFYRSRDGMDLTLCEIDLTTNTVLLSAAKRHSYIQQNGEIEIISGDKRGIGGGEEIIVDFTLQTFEMKPGDALYLFSDGYPDQFGGPSGRKLKLSGAKTILQGLKDHNKKDYGAVVSSNFELWQSDFEQIDDVLFMGILF